MDYRIATQDDLDLLAEWNKQLIQDEGHRNPMTVPELQERMKGWIESDYKAVVFCVAGEEIAYGLYREGPAEIYLRQFFVRRDRRRAGLGREAMAILRDRIWPKGKRLTVEVLTKNHEGIGFWKAIGYQEYCLTLEMMPSGLGLSADRG